MKKVTIKDKVSLVIEIGWGVLQESVLGLTLFNVYINNLHDLCVVKSHSISWRC